MQIEKPPQGFVNTVSVPVVYEDDGTVWFAWTGRPPAHVMMTSLRPFLPGDMNRDGLVNNFDIDPFVLLLVGK
ncbi:MAG: hypothetical protein JNG88_06695 [Phycisphaerales bacterium]|nr:hypothetical protein [Phycisphaerales bacterium]